MMEEQILWGLIGAGKFVFGLLAIVTVYLLFIGALNFVERRMNAFSAWLRRL